MRYAHDVVMMTRMKAAAAAAEWSSLSVHYVITGNTSAGRAASSARAFNGIHRININLHTHLYVMETHSIFMRPNCIRVGLFFSAATVARTMCLAKWNANRVFS